MIPPYLLRIIYEQRERELAQAIERKRRQRKEKERNIKQDLEQKQTIKIDPTSSQIP